MMAISETNYNNQKEYWDYQRKVQYNKEQLSAIAEKFEGRVYRSRNFLWNRNNAIND